MRYSPRNYARAFAALAAQTRTADEQEDLVLRFWETVARNGDSGKAPLIVAHAERLLRRADGRDLYEVETARKLKTGAREMLAGAARPRDVVNEIVNPELVAGVRITKNGEEHLDVSLRARIDSLFAVQ